MGSRYKHKFQSFSLLELLVVITIIGILVTFAIPSYQKALEASRAENAEFNLKAIYHAQKRYKLERKTYYQCTANPCTASEVEENLGVYLNDPYFNYSISATATAFTANATRIDGSLCLNKNMTLIETGSEPQKECGVW